MVQQKNKEYNMIHQHKLYHKHAYNQSVGTIKEMIMWPDMTKQIQFFFQKEPFPLGRSRESKHYCMRLHIY